MNELLENFKKKNNIKPLTKEEKENKIKQLEKDLSKLNNEVNSFLTHDYIDEISLEHKYFGCENGCSCFVCVGKDKCSSWIIK